MEAASGAQGFTRDGTRGHPSTSSRRFNSTSSPVRWRNGWHRQCSPPCFTSSWGFDNARTTYPKMQSLTGPVVALPPLRSSSTAQSCLACYRTRPSCRIYPRGTQNLSFLHCQKWFGQLTTGEAREAFAGSAREVFSVLQSQSRSKSAEQLLPGLAQAGCEEQLTAPRILPPAARYQPAAPNIRSCHNCIHPLPFLKQRGS